MALPVIGRLRASEYPILVCSLLLVVLESIMATLTRLLPSRIIDGFSRLAKDALKVMPAKGSAGLESGLKHHVKRIASATGFVELCEIYGYQAEEHIVQTRDGYLLGLHRIGGPRNSTWRAGGPRHRSNKRVVYLHHGLLMNSEVWVCVTDPKRALPFVLADLGYDVWLGNNRGNKYSKKHVFREPSDTNFWNFSIDDFALYDIPDTVDYILELTGQRNLSYIGFSQGSAQAFAALSINPSLNDKVNLFVALAPAMAPPGIRQRIVQSLVNASPSVIYLFFGRRAILRSTIFWQSTMLPALFVRIMDWALVELFNWKSLNISYAQKRAAYPHLYSFTSVKSVVHWFQIMRAGRFQMYDDDNGGLFSSRNFYQVSTFPTRNIMTPIVLVYGAIDSLVDIDVMLSSLPQTTLPVAVDGHEHLDLMWGEDVDSVVFPHIVAALGSLDGENTKAERPNTPQSDTTV